MTAGTPDIPAVMRSVHAELQRVLDAPICVFGVFDPPTQTVEVVWQIHNGEELPGGSFPLGNGFTSQVIRTARPLLIRDWAASGPRVQVQYATDQHGLPQSSITAPVVLDGQVRGVVSVQSYQSNAFDEKDLELLTGVADKLALTIFAPASNSAIAAAAAAGAAVGELVLDAQGRLVQLNEPARRLLCAEPSGVILGHPVLESQSGKWPLGTQTLTDRLRPLIDALTTGGRQPTELNVEDSGGHLAWSISAVLRDGKPAGARLQFRTADA